MDERRSKTRQRVLKAGPIGISGGSHQLHRAKPVEGRRGSQHAKPGRRSR
jgi:hypothetical protein